MKKNTIVVAPIVALRCLSACAATPEAVAEPTPTPTYAGTAAIASANIASLTSSSGAALPAGEPTAINCTVDGRRSARWTATFVDAPKQTVEVAAPTAGSNQSVWQQVDFGAGWAMAIVPGDVRNLDVVTNLPNEAGHDYSVGAGYLDAIEATCLAIRFDQAADAGAMTGFVWRDEGGVFYRDAGGAVPSANFAVDGDTLAAYSDTTLDVFGVIAASGFQGSYRPSKSKDPFPFLQFSTVQDAGRWRTYVVGVLPSGSTNAKVSFLSGASSPSMATAPAASGEVFVLAAARTAKQKGDLVSTITYTDASGKKVTPRWAR